MMESQGLLDVFLTFESILEIHLIESMIVSILGSVIFQTTINYYMIVKPMKQQKGRDS